MIKLNKEQQIQESRYQFPYHYIPRFENGRFEQSVVLPWGYKYLSYISFVLSKLGTLEFQSLLDVGCGDGRFLYEGFKVFPQKELVGVDYSRQAIQHARAMNPDVEYICGDITDRTLFDRKFDIITLIETLEHIPPDEIEGFVSALHYYLKDEGILIITVPSQNVQLNPKHFQHFDVASLRNSVKSSFVISEHHFLNKISIWVRLLERVLVNRFFILNERRISTLIYRSYSKYFLNAKENNAQRICALCRKENRVSTPLS